MIGTSPTLLAALYDPGMMLLGVLLVLYGAALTLAFLLKKIPELAHALTATLVLLLTTLDGHIILNLLLPSTQAISRPSSFSFLFLEHRWFLVALAGFLLLTSAIILFVYGTRLMHGHARHYYRLVQCSIVGSFLALLASVFESTIF